MPPLSSSLLSSLLARLRRRAPVLLGLAMAAIAAGSTAARSEALLLIEADSGKVLHAEHATYPWYPASLTKLMTAYVTLRAVKARRLGLDTPLTVSANAAAQQPSKMGFQVGTTVTVDNALKMLMVKSANDMAVVLAEGVSGSVEAFATEMNEVSQRLGMTQSQWVNPNGLPDERQITSARDMAILSRALIRDFPEHELYWRIPAIKFGRRTMRNYNTLIDRYPGADGMKTGFICASGFNLVASATRNGKRLIAVVLGAPSSAERAETAAGLLEKGFAASALSWLTPALGTVEGLQPIAAAPPNLREDMCGKNRRRPAAENEEQVVVNPNVDSASAYAIMAPNLAGVTASGKPGSLLQHLPPSMPPIQVFVGAPKKQAAAPAATVSAARAAPPTGRPAPMPRPRPRR